MGDKQTTIGPAYKGSRLRIENPSAGRASRNVNSLVPPGYKIVENHGSYIVVEKTGGQAPPPGYDPKAPNSPASKRAVEAETEKQNPATPRIWLNGELVTYKTNTNPDGSVNLVVTGKDGAERPLAPVTAFEALDGGEIEPAAPFLMRNEVGALPAGVSGPVSPAGWMTVGGAASWLAALSTKDPEAYGAMLQKLYSAGYLSKGDLTAARGKWSSAAGTALARAARDTAVVNTTAGGKQTTLDDFLNSKQGAAEEMEAASGRAAWTPVERQYTDPEDIKAAAKSEAEQFLGRQLSDAEENQLVTHFRGLEDAMYDAIDSAGQQGKNATFVKPGSGQIDHFVEDTPATQQEGANFRAGQYGQALKRLFGVATGG